MVTRILIILFALTLSASAQRICPPNQVNRNGLVGRWLVPGKQTGNVATPTLCLDDSGKGNHGTVVSNANYGIIFSRPAMTFNGSSQYVVNTNVSSALNVGNNITISAWARPTAVGQSGGSDVAGLAISASAPFGPAGIEWNSASQFSFFTGATDNTTDSLTSGAKALNTWHHVAVTYDGTTKRIYVNGTLENSLTYAKSLKYTNPLYLDIGSFVLYLVGNYFTGSIDDVRIYNRALSAAEIRAIYQGEQ